MTATTDETTAASPLPTAPSSNQQGRSLHWRNARPRGCSRSNCSRGVRRPGVPWQRSQDPQARPRVRPSSPVSKVSVGGGSLLRQTGCVRVTARVRA
jgi:hypothetical protein